MRSKRRGLTPYKTILVFLIAFVLVSIHEMDRIMGWLEGSALESGSESQMLEYYSKARETIQDLGLDQVIDAENDALSFTDHLPLVGSVGKKSRRDILTGAQFVMAPVKSWEFMGMVGEIFLEANASLLRMPPESVQTVMERPTTLRPYTIGSLEQTLPPVDPGIGAHEKAVDEGHEKPSENRTASLPAPSVDPVTAEGPALKVLKPKTVLIAGDSMILEGFGVAMERKLKDYPGLKVIRKGKYSSGLSRPDYFDWMAYLKELLDTYQPDLLVVCLGANDPQDILDTKHKRHFVATDSWNEIYARRTGEFLDIARQARAAVIWVGLPIMGQAKYGGRIKNLNQVVEKVCRRKATCCFVDSWKVLANKKGEFTTFLKTEDGHHIRIRAKDKIHVTEKGGEILVDHVLSETTDFVEFPKNQPATETTAAKSRPSTLPN